MKRETELSRIRKENIVMQLKNTDADKTEEVLKLLATEVDPSYELLNTLNLNLTTNMIDKLIRLFDNEDNLDLKYMEIDKLISIGIIGENSEKILDHLYNIIYNPNPNLPNVKKISEYIVKALINKKTTCVVLSNSVKNCIEPIEGFLHKSVSSQNTLEQDRRSELKSEEPIQMTPDEKLQFFINVLSSSDIQASITAIRELGKIGSDTAIQSLINVTQQDSADVWVREAAALALAEKAPYEAAQCLIHLFHSGDPELSIRVAKTLGKVKSDTAVQFLTDQLTKPNYTSVLKSIMNTLGEVEPSKVIKALRRTTSRMVNKVRMESPLLGILDSSQDEYVRSEAITLLVKILPPQDAEEILIMNLSGSYDNFSITTILELGKIASSKSEEALIKYLSNASRDIRIRIMAAEVLGKIASNKSEEPLINCLSDELSDIKIRIIAAQILGNLDSQKAIKTLINIISSSKNHNSLRLAVSGALAQIFPQGTMQFLIDSLNNSDKYTRLAAAKTLRKINPHDTFCSNLVIKPLTVALSDSDIDVRIEAAQALTKIAPKQAVEPLINALRNSNVDVRITAAQTLREIDPAPEEAVDPIINALCDSNIDVRIAAAEALGKIASEKATQPLFDVLSSDRADDKILTPAYEALWKIGTEKSINLSIDLLNNAIKSGQLNKIGIFVKIIKKNKNKLDIYIDKLLHVEKLSAKLKERGLELF